MLTNLQAALILARYMGLEPAVVVHWMTTAERDAMINEVLEELRR